MSGIFYESFIISLERNKSPCSLELLIAKVDERTNVLRQVIHTTLFAPIFVLVFARNL